MSAAVLPRPGPASARAAWRLSDAAPADWAAALERCGGSFFHTPPALAASLPAGRPVFARRVDGDRVLAVAAGVACGCRLSRRARHLRFAALPAAAPGADPIAAASSLAAHLADAGAAEVEMDSFASPVSGDVPAGAIGGRTRTEFVIPLLPDVALTLGEMGKTHRRHVSAGDRAGWTLRALAGAEAGAVLTAAQAEASRRATERGDGFATMAFGADDDAPPSLDAPWGVRTFAAFDGATPLAAARVGWGNRRAFYLVGGSTPEGYRRSASAWLHAAVVRALSAAGFAEYDLGGAPAEAADPAHPSHGLHRFKTGFGARPVACRGLRWEPAPAHLAAHRAMVRIFSPTAAGR